MLNLSGPRFFGTVRTRERGGLDSIPLDSPENWKVEFSIYTYATIEVCLEKFSFEGAKGLKIWRFSKMFKQKTYYCERV